MDIEKLKAAGFIETTYPGQEGVFLTKRLSIAEMPEASATLVDWEIIGDTDIAVVEYVPDPLFPGGGVQMTIEHTDYIQDAIPADGEEGLALLRDAGVDC